MLIRNQLAFGRRTKSFQQNVRLARHMSYGTMVSTSCKSQVCAQPASTVPRARPGSVPLPARHYRHLTNCCLNTFGGITWILSRASQAKIAPILESGFSISSWILFTHECRFENRGKNDHTAGLVEQVFWYVLWNIEDFFQHGTRIFDAIIFLLIVLGSGESIWRPNESHQRKSKAPKKRTEFVVCCAHHSTSMSCPSVSLASNESILNPHKGRCHTANYR